MDIAFYIAELLKQHNQVNVPGLGTFYKLRIAAFYDGESNAFRPPLQRLTFKSNFDNNTALEEYISLKKSISISSTTYFIEKFVSHIHDLLETSQFAELKFLGTLQKKDQDYQFEPSEEDPGNAFYGLQPVPEQRTKSVKIEKPVIYLADQVKSSGDNSIISPEDETTPEKSRKMGYTSKIAIIFAGVILIGVVVYFFYPKAFDILLKPNTTNRRKQPAIVPAEEVPKSLSDSMAKADTIYNALKEQGLDAEKAPDTLEVSTKKQLVNTIAAGLTFEIISAAFNSKTEAETYIKSMKMEGIEAKTVEGMPGPMIKISLGTFNDIASANKELVRIKKDINQEAWVARVKPQKTN